MMPSLVASRWARPGAAALAGIAASSALPPTGMLFALLALSVPLYWLSRAERRLEAAALGLATGFGWFLVSLSWTSQAFVTSGGWHVFLIPFPILGLPLLLGLFWGAAFLLAAVACRHPVARLLMAAALLALAEYARGFVLTGFPWNTPGLTFATGDAGFGAAAWLGPWGLNAAALLLALVPALLLCRARALSVAALVPVLLALGLGYQHAGRPEADSAAAGMTVRLVQPNVPQEEKWLYEKRRDHLDRLVDFSRRPSAVAVDMTVWPESAFAGMLEQELDLLSEVARAASSGGGRVLTGSLRIEEPEGLDAKPRFYNSMVLLDPEGRPVGQYDKRHLVPFGEYAPLRRYIPFVDAIAGPYDFSPGARPEALILERRDGRRVRMLPLICYEVIFPDAVRRALEETGADIVVTVTNDDWFGDSTGPRQHLAMARMRAAELGVPMVRVANTGISAAIDGYGRVTNRIELGTAGIADAAVGGRVDTPYSRHGNLVFWVMVAALAGVALAIQGLTGKSPRQ